MQSTEIGTDLSCAWFFSFPLCWQSIWYLVSVYKPLLQGVSVQTVVLCTLYTVLTIVMSVHCTASCTLYTLYCTDSCNLNTLHCTDSCILYILHCTGSCILYDLHCTDSCYLYTVQTVVLCTYTYHCTHFHRQLPGTDTKYISTKKTPDQLLGTKSSQRQQFK